MELNTLKIYYLVTPMFFILQYYFNINIRLSMPGEEESWIYIYYLTCFTASFVAFKSIIAGAVFSLVESSINILLLLLSVMFPIFTIGNGDIENINIKFGVAELMHFFIVGFILMSSFYMNPLISRKN